MTIALPRLDRSTAEQRGITIADFLVPIRVGERISSRARHLALVVLGAVFIALTANVYVTLPNTPVPVSGQTFSVLLVGGALGLRRGLLATTLYLVMGLFLPVYAERDSGIGQFFAFEGGTLILGATGGYLIGFAIAAALVGRLAELGWDRHIGGALGAMALGNLVIYALGVPWLMAATGMDAGKAFTAGVAPFLVGDAVKLALAAGVFPVAWWLVGRRPSDR